MLDAVYRFARASALAGAPLLAAAVAGCAGPADRSDLTASGHVEVTEVRLSAKVGGRLETVTLEEGDSLEIDQVVARFETVDLDLRLRQAEA